MESEIKYFTCTSDEVVDDTRLSKYANLVYGVLCRHADTTGRACPGQELIAQKTGLTPKQVRAGVSELEKRWLIRVSDGGGMGRGHGRATKAYIIDDLRRHFSRGEVTELELAQLLGLEPGVPGCPQEDVYRGPIRPTVKLQAVDSALQPVKKALQQVNRTHEVDRKEDRKEEGRENAVPSTGDYPPEDSATPADSPPSATADTLDAFRKPYADKHGVDLAIVPKERDCLLALTTQHGEQEVVKVWRDTLERRPDKALRFFITDYVQERAKYQKEHPEKPKAPEPTYCPMCEKIRGGKHEYFGSFCRDCGWSSSEDSTEGGCRELLIQNELIEATPEDLENIARGEALLKETLARLGGEREKGPRLVNIADIPKTKPVAVPA